MSSVSDLDKYLICNRCPNTCCIDVGTDVIMQLIEATGDFWSGQLYALVSAGKKRTLEVLPEQVPDILLMPQDFPDERITKSHSEGGTRGKSGSKLI